MKVDADLALRAGGLQAVLVLILALAMSLAFSSGFFETYGWIVGPVAWLGCAAVVALRLTVPLFPAVMGAAVAGIPMLIALALGTHWIGILIGVIVFAVWCGTLEPSKPRRPQVQRRNRVS